jgi:hypothetical protein
MKQLLPNTSPGRWRLALLPFKAFIPASLLVLLVLSYDPGVSGGKSIVASVIYGCLGCVGVLLIGGPVAAIRTREPRLMWSALAFAGIGIVLVSFLWGGAFPTPTKSL